MMSKKKPSSKSYDVGYARPPKKFRFRRGKSGNPSGKRRKASAPDLKAQLQSALNETVTIRSGKHPKVMSKGAAGIDQLVDQFAAGDRNARRDLFALCEKFGVDITNREALEGAIEDVLTAQDEVILADFVERHGGHYHRRDGSVGLLPRQKSNGLTLSSNGSNLAALPRERLDV
jgi:hypothetical protein